MGTAPAVVAVSINVTVLSSDSTLLVESMKIISPAELNCCALFIRGVTTKTAQSCFSVSFTWTPMPVKESLDIVTLMSLLLYFKVVNSHMWPLAQARTGPGGQGGDPQPGLWGYGPFRACPGLCPPRFYVTKVTNLAQHTSRPINSSKTMEMSSSLAQKRSRIAGIAAILSLGTLWSWALLWASVSS